MTTTQFQFETVALNYVCSRFSKLIFCVQTCYGLHHVPNSIHHLPPLPLHTLVPLVTKLTIPWLISSISNPIIITFAWPWNFFFLFALPKNKQASSTQFMAFTTSSWLGLPHLLHSFPKVFLYTSSSSIFDILFSKFLFPLPTTPKFFLAKGPSIISTFCFPSLFFPLAIWKWLMFTSWWYLKPSFGKKVHISI